MVRQNNFKRLFKELKHWLIPKNLQSKLIVEQNRAGVFVPWVMDISMDITIDGIDYVAYMAASQYAVMTQNNVYRVTIEK